MICKLAIAVSRCAPQLTVHPQATMPTLQDQSPPNRRMYSYEARQKPIDLAESNKLTSPAAHAENSSATSAVESGTDVSVDTFTTAALGMQVKSVAICQPQHSTHFHETVDTHPRPGKDWTKRQPWHAAHILEGSCGAVFANLLRAGIVNTWRTRRIDGSFLIVPGGFG